MKKYKSFAIVSIYCLGTALAIIISIVFFIKVNVAQAASLPEIQPVHPITAIEQYAMAEGLKDLEIVTLKRIAYCESKYNPYAKNSNSTAAGVYQFLSSSWSAWGEGSVYDTRENVRAAIKYYKHSGTQPWVCK